MPTPAITNSTSTPIPETISANIQGSIPILPDLRAIVFSYLPRENQIFFAPFNNNEYRPVLIYRPLRRTVDEVIAWYVQAKQIFISPTVSSQLRGYARNLNNLDKLKTLIDTKRSPAALREDEVESYEQMFHQLSEDGLHEFLVNLFTIFHSLNSAAIDQLPEGKLKVLAKAIKNYEQITDTTSDTSRKAILVHWMNDPDTEWLRGDLVTPFAMNTDFVVATVVKALQEEVEAAKTSLSSLPADTTLPEYRSEKQIALIRALPFQTMLKKLDELRLLQDLPMTGDYRGSRAFLELVKAMVFYEQPPTEILVMINKITQAERKNEALMLLFDFHISKKDLIAAHGLIQRFDDNGQGEAEEKLKKVINEQFQLHLSNNDLTAAENSIVLLDAFDQMGPLKSIVDAYLALGRITEAVRIARKIDLRAPNDRSATLGKVVNKLMENRSNRERAEALINEMTSESHQGEGRLVIFESLFRPPMNFPAAQAYAETISDSNYSGRAYLKITKHLISLDRLDEAHENLARSGPREERSALRRELATAYVAKKEYEKAVEMTEMSPFFENFINATNAQTIWDDTKDRPIDGKFDSIYEWVAKVFYSQNNFLETLRVLNKLRNKKLEVFNHIKVNLSAHLCRMVIDPTQFQEALALAQLIPSGFGYNVEIIPSMANSLLDLRDRTDIDQLVADADKLIAILPATSRWKTDVSRHNLREFQRSLPKPTPPAPPAPPTPPTPPEAPNPVVDNSSTTRSPTTPASDPIDQQPPVEQPRINPPTPPEQPSEPVPGDIITPPSVDPVPAPIAPEPATPVPPKTVEQIKPSLFNRIALSIISFVRNLFQMLANLFFRWKRD